MRAADWKQYYATERRRLGEPGLRALVEAAPDVPVGAALVFPHFRLDDGEPSSADGPGDPRTAPGRLVAAAAKAVVASGADRVVALGVLHGGRRRDEEAVRQARSGDAAARVALRGVHGPSTFAGPRLRPGTGAPGDAAVWTEEFSLDAFRVLVDVAASMAGRRPPVVVERYPFLVGEGGPLDLRGLEALRREAEGAALVATADPVHHGAGYGTPAAERRDRHDAATLAWARAAVEGQLGLLQAADWARFARATRDAGSDFRDAGPVLAALRPGRGDVLDLALVSYARTLAADEPTWVAGALVAWA